MKNEGPSPLSFAAILSIALAAIAIIFSTDIPWANIGEALASMWR